jgi:hypothetical protein
VQIIFVFGIYGLASYLKRLIKHLDKIKPINTKAMPPILAINILLTAIFISPARRRLKFSRLNVENVVNPPRMPIKINILTCGETARPSKSPHRKPMKKEPVRLTRSVLKGNTPFENL